MLFAILDRDVLQIAAARIAGPAEDEYALVGVAQEWSQTVFALIRIGRNGVEIPRAEVAGGIGSRGRAHIADLAVEDDRDVRRDEFAGFDQRLDSGNSLSDIEAQIRLVGANEILSRLHNGPVECDDCLPRVKPMQMGREPGWIGIEPNTEQTVGLGDLIGEALIKPGRHAVPLYSAIASPSTR